MKKLLGLAVAGGLLLASCNPNKDDQVGRFITPPSENFAATSDLSLSIDNADFNGGDIVTATINFNEAVDVNITFVGTESGATREFTLQAVDHIDANSFQWYGNHTGAENPFFKTGEQVIAYVTFFGSEIAFTDTMTITTAYDFTSNPNVYATDGADFEAGRPTWQYFSCYGTAATCEVIDGTEIPMIQGDAAFRQVSSDNSKLGYRSGFDFTDGYLFYFNQFPFDDVAPENLYFNIWAYGIGDANSTLQIVMIEDDNENENLDPTTEDRLLAAVPLDFEGWKLISLRYSDIPFNGNPSFGGNGNKIKEPGKLLIASINLEAGATGERQMIVDFPMFTIGGPFDPENF